MKRVLFLVLMLSLSFVRLSYSQPPLADWKILEQIELLVSSKEDLARIFSPREFLSWDGNGVEHFSGDSAVIDVEYSSGSCTDSEDWNVPAGIVTGIRITPKEFLDRRQLGISYSSFRKQRIDPQRKSIVVRYDKESGIAIWFFGPRVDSVYLFPTRASYAKLCDRREVKDYYAGKRWSREPIPKNLIIDYNLPANVVDLSLEMKTGGIVSVVTKAIDPDNDVLTYNYGVSEGKIVGTGANVTWDLSNAQPGSYSIWAAVDDGVGFRGKYIRKLVSIP